MLLSKRRLYEKRRKHSSLVKAQIIGLSILLIIVLGIFIFNEKISEFLTKVFNILTSNH